MSLIMVKASPGSPSPATESEESGITVLAYKPAQIWSLRQLAQLLAMRLRILLRRKRLQKKQQLGCKLTKQP